MFKSALLLKSTNICVFSHILKQMTPNEIKWIITSYQIFIKLLAIYLVPYPILLRLHRTGAPNSLWLVLFSTVLSSNFLNRYSLLFLSAFFCSSHSFSWALFCWSKGKHRRRLLIWIKRWKLTRNTAKRYSIQQFYYKNLVDPNCVRLHENDC